MTAIVTPFIPHPLLRGGQMQTLAGQVLTGARVPERFAVEPVPLSDGDQLLLHVDAAAGTAPADQAKPLVILMHGLGGSSESSYILRISAKLNALGYDVVRFNHRGCARGGEALARQIYHAGRVEDLAATLRHIEMKWPGRRYLVAAFSLSANMLLRFLGETDTERAHPSLMRTMAVCPPVDLEACSLALDAQSNWHIDVYFTRRLLATAAARSRLFKEENPVRFPRKMTLRRFDELYTAPLGGFTSRTDYYDRSSARHVTGKIKTPTLLLAAADDPIIPPRSFEGVDFSSAVHLHIERTGGHMGFLSALPTRFGDRRWMDVAVIDWVDAP